MKQWEYTFDPVTRDAWIQQIKSDLKKATLDTLQSEWWPGEIVSPLIHPTDAPKEIIALPDHLFQDPPHITEWISITQSNADQINRQVLDSLDFGTRQIIFCFEEPIPFEKDWMNGVISRYIDLQIQPAHTDHISMLIAEKQIPEEITIRLDRSKDFHDSSKWILPDESGNNLYTRFKRVYTFPPDGHWTNSATSVLQRLINDLEEWLSHGGTPGSFFNQSILSCQTDREYLKQIIQIRVLHLIMQNLIKHFAGEPEHHPAYRYMECMMSPFENESPDMYLVRASMSGTAISLSGVHSFCIQHDRREAIPAFYRRINRDIHHVLQMESLMAKGKDPLAGAYVVDQYTRKWAESIWTNLHFKN